MKRMILFTIGSVQEFIIASRKTRDLQNASSMLRTLVNDAIEEVERYDGKVILPYMEKGGKLMCPNYFVATYNHDQSLGQALKELVINNFATALTNELNRHEVEYASVSEQLQQQLRTALEIYWCDVPISDDAANNETLQKLYDCLEAIKNTKQFAQFTEPEGEKCTLCGIRNGIFYNSKQPYKLQKHYSYQGDRSISGNSIYPILEQVKARQGSYKYNADDFITMPLAIDLSEVKALQWDLKENECLCGVCMNKRLEENDLTKEQNRQEILSLAGFALKDWLERICQDQNISSPKKPGTDMHEVIYKYFEKGRKESNIDQISPRLANCLDELFMDEQKKPTPPTYYCLYRMDFDSIGKRLRREADPTSLSSLIYQFLNRFTESVEEEFKNVRIVYAGGDDLLALMSVQSSLDFAIKLKKTFAEIFTDTDSAPTYSQGLFYAHYKTPFTDIIRLSKAKLEAVKERFKRDGKNGTVISMLTDGFSDQDVYFKNAGELNIETIKDVLAYFTDHASYFHFTLGQSFLGLEEAVERNTATFSQMFLAEQNRLMKRSLKKDGEQAEVEGLAQLDKLENLLYDFYYGDCVQSQTIDLTNYFNLFSIVKKLNSQIAEVS